MARTLIGTNIEATSAQYGGYSRKSARIIAEVVWSFTEFNNYPISTLSRKPASPESLRCLVGTYNNEANSYLTSEEATKRVQELSCIRGIEVFYIRHKSVSTFPLTCCINQYSLVDKYIKYI